MKTNILTTVAAALIAGVAGLTLATGASAAPFKMPNLCTKVYGGKISKPAYSSFTGYKNRICVRHTIVTDHSTRPIRAQGVASFSKYTGTPSTLKRQLCRKSYVIVHFYKSTNAGWKRLQSAKAYGVPGMKGGQSTCYANAYTKYYLNSTLFRTVVFAMDAHKTSKYRLIASLMRSDPKVH